MLVIDCFPYNGEEVVGLRLSTVYPLVDKIFVTESRQSFTGIVKDQLFFETNRATFEPYMDKIVFLLIDFPEFESRDPWLREAHQRNYPADRIRQMFPGEKLIVFSCDADEIPSETILTEVRHVYDMLHEPCFLQMHFFYYNFENLKKYPWNSAFVINDIGLDRDSFHAYRNSHPKKTVFTDAGFHLSFFSSLQDIASKIKYFSHTEYDRPEYKASEHVLRCIANGKDIFDRPNEDMMPPPEDVVAKLPKGWEQLAARLVLLQQKQN
jgi:beta-1,4-mannosyl-glycoprotein beta-1,4-N-acetylglucosaminyltransferase